MAQKREGEDRRSYFRIDIDLPLEIRPATPLEREDMTAAYLDDLDLLDLNPMPPESVDMDLKDWMRMVNDKLNTIMAMITTAGKPPLSLKMARINLSASGISFFTPDTRYKVDDVLQIKMTLEEKKSSKTIRLFGRVVISNRLPGKNISKVAVEFVSVSEDITHDLANFIMNKERELLRNRLR